MWNKNSINKAVKQKLSGRAFKLRKIGCVNSSGVVVVIARDVTVTDSKTQK